MHPSIEDKLASYVDALRPIIYIHDFDFERVDDIIGRIAKGTAVHEWTNGLLHVDFVYKTMKTRTDLKAFLSAFIESSVPTLLVLKDIHPHLNDPEVLSLLKIIAQKTMKAAGYQVTIFIVATKLVVPQELEKLMTIVEIPYPKEEDIKRILTEYAQELSIPISDRTKNEMTVSFKGLSEFEIRQILNLAYQEDGTLDLNDTKLILKEKEQIIRKSEILDIVEVHDDIQDVGGLEALKDYLNQKSSIFKNLGSATRAGVDIPRGILIVGMPGCGKSITAKATAALFQVPLLRLDVGKLMGKYVGESEENLRRAIRTAEAVSPCVLWIDEIEKAFAGLGGTSGASDVTTRLFGHFLTWLQEKQSMVYVVATSNDISKLPPEFLRKGRFDELFHVDLPSGDERKQIFEIHLRKRHQDPRKIDVIGLIDRTKGFSGADIESVIIETLERCFVNEDTLTTELLIETINETKSISVTLKDKINEIKGVLEKYDIRDAANVKKKVIPKNKDERNIRTTKAATSPKQPNLYKALSPFWGR